MRKVALLLSLMGVVFLSAKSMIPVKEVDLSFFLWPRYVPAIIAIDSQNNIYITQRQRTEFIKINAKGAYEATGPFTREGRIKSLDVTEAGDVVVFFTRTPGLIAAGKGAWGIVFFNGRELQKKWEIDFDKLSSIFFAITEVRVLRPENLLLIRGIRKGSSMSLHVIDFKGNLINSFSPCEGDFKNQDVITDCFSFGFLTIDYRDKIIYQIFPLTGIIRAFDYKGQMLATGVFPKEEITNIVADNGKLILENFPVVKRLGSRLLHKRGPFLLMDLFGKELRILAEKVEWNPEIDGILITSDGKGNFFFLAGPARTILRVCRIYQ